MLSPRSKAHPSCSRMLLSQEPPRALSKAEASLPKPISYTHAVQSAMSMVAGLFRLEELSGGRLRVVRLWMSLMSACSRACSVPYSTLRSWAIDADLNALEVFYRAGLRSLGIVWSRPNIFGAECFSSRTRLISARLTDEQGFVRVTSSDLIDVSPLNEKGFWDVAAITDAPIGYVQLCACTCPVPRNLTDKQLDAIKDLTGSSASTSQ